MKFHVMLGLLQFGLLNGDAGGGGRLGGDMFGLISIFYIIFI